MNTKNDLPTEVREEENIVRIPEPNPQELFANHVLIIKFRAIPTSNYNFSSKYPPCELFDLIFPKNKTSSSPTQITDIHFLGIPVNDFLIRRQTMANFHISSFAKQLLLLLQQRRRRHGVWNNKDCKTFARSNHFKLNFRLWRAQTVSGGLPVASIASPCMTLVGTNKFTVSWKATRKRPTNQHFDPGSDKMRAISVKVEATRCEVLPCSVSVAFYFFWAKILFHLLVQKTI